MSQRSGPPPSFLRVKQVAQVFCNHPPGSPKAGTAAKHTKRDESSRCPAAERDESLERSKGPLSRALCEPLPYAAAPANSSGERDRVKESPRCLGEPLIASSVRTWVLSRCGPDGSGRAYLSARLLLLLWGPASGGTTTLYMDKIASKQDTTS